MLMQEELHSLNNLSNRYLGFTKAEVDEALAGLEEMERELMEEWEQALLPEEEELEDEPALICPVCKHGRLQQNSETHVIALVFLDNRIESTQTIASFNFS